MGRYPSPADEKVLLALTLVVVNRSSGFDHAVVPSPECYTGSAA
jgi:hypothetical protein